MVLWGPSDTITLHQAAELAETGWQSSRQSALTRLEQELAQTRYALEQRTAELDAANQALRQGEERYQLLFAAPDCPSRSLNPLSSLTAASHASTVGPVWV